MNTKKKKKKEKKERGKFGGETEERVDRTPTAQVDGPTTRRKDPGTRNAS